MANITLKIDDKFLENVRLFACKKKTSINAIIKERLEQFVSSGQTRETTLKDLDSFFRRSKARVGRKTWSRDEIHER